MRLLHVDHDHDHDDGDHDHHDHDHEHDHNLRAAYVHVLADAFTSVLAIGALVGGRWLGWRFLDPMMGIVGGVVISRWSYTLRRGAARQLLDAVDLAARLRKRLEDVPGTEVADLHVWEIGPHAVACVASVVASEGSTPLDYTARIRDGEQLAHVTIEVHRA